MKTLKKLYPTHFLQFGVVWVYEYVFAGALSAPYIIHTALNAISPAAWAQMPPPPTPSPFSLSSPHKLLPLCSSARRHKAHLL